MAKKVRQDGAADRLVKAVFAAIAYVWGGALAAIFVGGGFISIGTAGAWVFGWDKHDGGPLALLAIAVATALFGTLCAWVFGYFED